MKIIFYRGKYTNRWFLEDIYEEGPREVQITEEESAKHTSSAVGLLYGSTDRRLEIKSFADEVTFFHVWSSKLYSPWRGRMCQVSLEIRNHSELSTFQYEDKCVMLYRSEAKFKWNSIFGLQDITSSNCITCALIPSINGSYICGLWIEFTLFKFFSSNLMSEGNVRAESFSLWSTGHNIRVDFDSTPNAVLQLLTVGSPGASQRNDW